MGEPLVARYWCYMCSQMVSPAMGVDIKCPFCDSGFVEEMNGTQDMSPSDLESDQSLSMWAPNLLGAVGSGLLHSRRHQRDEEENDSDPDRDFVSATRRRWRNSAIFRLIQDLEDRNWSDPDFMDYERERERERDRDSLILIDTFNRALILQGSLDSHGQSQDSDGAGGLLLGDYFLGPGLDLLLQHLAENDPNRYGTPPAKKEAIEALPTVKIKENMSCSVCLEDFDIGAEVKQMPCKHSFHGGCILPWLKLHSSCPVCRLQLPADESKELIGSETGIRAGAGGVGSGRGTGNRFMVSVPWPFNDFLSSSGSQNGSGNSSSNTSSSSSRGNSYADAN